MDINFWKKYYKENILQTDEQTSNYAATFNIIIITKPIISNDINVYSKLKVNNTLFLKRTHTRTSRHNLA